MIRQIKHFLYIFKILLIIGVFIYNETGNEMVNETVNKTNLTFNFNKRTGYYYINLI